MVKQHFPLHLIQVQQEERRSEKNREVDKNLSINIGQTVDWRDIVHTWSKSNSVSIFKTYSLGEGVFMRP